MRKITFVLLLWLASSVSVVAQQKITLDEIWGGAFRTKGMDELNNSLKEGSFGEEKVIFLIIFN